MFLPLSVKAFQSPLINLASIEPTIACEPNLLTVFETKFLSSINCVFIATLSAPAIKTFSMSKILFRPPPTVSGILISDATFSYIRRAAMGRRRRRMAARSAAPTARPSVRRCAPALLPKTPQAETRF